jgi:superfamily II DNA helicase RecQ
LTDPVSSALQRYADRGVFRGFHAVPGPGGRVNYVATIKEAERIHEEFGRKHALALYHGKLGAKERHEAQDRFMAGQVKAVVATNAFGLGIDKRDIRFIAHSGFSKPLVNALRVTHRPDLAANAAGRAFA